MATAADRTKGDWEARPPAGADADCDPRWCVGPKGEEFHVVCVTSQGNDEANAKYIALGTAVEDALIDMVAQACTVENGKLDSMALSAYADTMRLLATLGRLKIESEYGHRVIGTWITKEKKCGRTRR